MAGHELLGEGHTPGYLWIEQRDVTGNEGTQIAMARMARAAGDAETFYAEHPQLVRPEVIDVFGFSPEFVTATTARAAEIAADKATQAAGRPPSQYFDRAPTA